MALASSVCSGSRFSGQGAHAAREESQDLDVLAHGQELAPVRMRS